MGKGPKTRTDSSRCFRATLERMQSRLNWTIVRLPFDASRVFGKRGQINVKGDINGFPFRTCLFPAKSGGHILLVNKKMQKTAGVRADMTARFRLEPDTEKRVATTPASLERILSWDKSLKRWYGSLNQSTRNDIAKWIGEPKSEKARERRTEQIAERLLLVMDAESQLPPILQVAFARSPRASAGWESMSNAKRRSHLFGIFYYRTPEGRARRIDKVIKEAERKRDR